MANYRAVHCCSSITTAIVLVNLFASLAAGEQQVRLKASSYNAAIWNIDPDTGAATSPRLPRSGRGYYTQLSGITAAPNGTLYTFGKHIRDEGAASANTLVQLHPWTGRVLYARSIGGDPFFQDYISEGDLDFDPTTGFLYGIDSVYFGALFTIDPSTAVTNILSGPTPANEYDLSAMAFRADGTLFVLDTLGDRLMTLDKATGDILTSVSITPPLNYADTAGMDFHPLTGELYVIYGTGAPDGGKLYKLHPTTGSLTLVGPTGVQNAGQSTFSGLTFLLVPEPSALALTFFGSLFALLNFRRRQ